MSCPPVQALNLLLFLFSVAPSIAVPYSTMCGQLFDDPQGEVEPVTEDDIQVLLNPTGLSNRTELNFSWTVFGFKPSESFGTYLSIDCSHLEVPFVHYKGSAIGRVSLISPPVYNCTVLACFKIPPLNVFYYHVFGPYESQQDTEKVSSDPIPSSTPVPAITSDGTSFVYSTVSYSTFFEEEEFDDFYSTAFSISSTSTSIPYTKTKTSLHDSPSTTTSIDRVIEGTLTSTSSYSSVSSDGVQSTISSKLTSSVSTVTPIESGSVQGSGNETQDYTNQVVFAVVSSIILTTTLIVCGMVAWTTVRKCLSRKKIAKEIQENLGKTELFLVHVTPSPSLYTIISPLQTFTASYNDTSNDSKSDIKDTTTSSSSSSVTPSPPVSPTSSDNLFTSKTDSFVSHRISTKPVNTSMSTDTLSSYDSCSVEVTETAALKRHLPASTPQPTALPPVELLQLELEPGHTSSSSDWSSSGSCITYYKVFERRRDRVEGEVDISGDKSCSTYSDHDNHHNHHHHRYSFLDHFSSSQTTGHTYIQDCNSFNSSCS